MVHNGRCASAKSSNCKCSCGGDRHGSGMGSGVSYFSSGVRGAALKIIPTATKVVSLIPAIAPIAPLITPIYVSYKMISFGKKIYEYCNKNDFWKAFKEISEEAVTQKILQKEESHFGERVSNISHQIRIASESSQILKEMSQKTRVDETIYGDMLEGSVYNGIMSGIKSITSFAIGSALNG